MNECDRACEYERDGECEREHDGEYERPASQERIIERLKEQREREDRERMEEVDLYKKENKELKEKVSNLQVELTEKEVCVCVCARAHALQDVSLVYHLLINILLSLPRSPVEFNRPERTRLFFGLVRPEERLQAEIFGDRHRAEEGGVQQAGDAAAEGTA